MVSVKKALSAFGVAVAAVVVLGGPASAAVAATIDSVDRDGCVLTVNVTVEVAGTYFLGVFDDDVEIGGNSVEATEGASIQLTYTITSKVNDDAPGLGLYVFDAPEDPRELLADVDPFDFPGSDTIAAACAASGGEDSGESPPKVTLPTETVPKPETTVPAPPSAGEAPSNDEAPSSADNAPSSTDNAPSSGDNAPVAAPLQPKFTG